MRFDTRMENPAGITVENAVALNEVNHGAFVHRLKRCPRFTGQFKSNRKAMGICYHGLFKRLDVRTLDMSDFCDDYTHISFRSWVELLV